MKLRDATQHTSSLRNAQVWSPYCDAALGAGLLRGQLDVHAIIQIQIRLSTGFGLPLIWTRSGTHLVATILIQLFIKRIVRFRISYPSLHGPLGSHKSAGKSEHVLSRVAVTLRSLDSLAFTHTFYVWARVALFNFWRILVTATHFDGLFRSRLSVLHVVVQQ